jgi:phosphate transport system substrate-binding protein
MSQHAERKMQPTRRTIFLALGYAAASGAVRAADAVTTLKGAGATFPYPVLAKWFEAFHARYPDIEILYEPVGSGGGIERLERGELDFAASDVRISQAAYYSGGSPRFLRFPTTMGAVVPIYNLATLPRDLRFSPEALAGIYLGNIRKWNDLALQVTNRGVALPSDAISVVHRADRSGTSYVWTEYLSRVSPAWASSVGAHDAPAWPIGTGVPGNEGVAELVGRTPHSIGYVEYIFAIHNRLNYGIVRNRAGQYISASIESIAAAAEGAANRMAEDFQTSIVDPAGSGAYPIASFSWLVVPAEMADPAKKQAIKQFMEWMLGPGQNQAGALGYLSLPKELLAREERAVRRY